MRTRTHADMRYEGLGTVIALGAILLLSGCIGADALDDVTESRATQGTDSPAPPGPDPDPPAPDPLDPPAPEPPAPDPPEPDPPEPDEEYAWGLPASDTSISGNDGPAYASLRRSCDEGQQYLEVVAENGYGFRSPRNVVLFAAGIEVCRGNYEVGRHYYDHAAAVYGLAGLAPEGRAECDLYKSVRSVLEQRPREEFPCPDGAAPEYRSGPGGIDDPLTFDVDESIGEPEPPEPEPDSERDPEPQPEAGDGGTTTDPQQP